MIVVDPLKMSVQSKLVPTVLYCWVYSDDQYVILYLFTAQHSGKTNRIKNEKNFSDHGAE
jgi:general stress protein 26